MNDKQQLQAMGEHQAEQHMCMAKQIEDLQARLQECANGAAKMQEQRDCAYKMMSEVARQLDAANKKIAAMTWLLVRCKPYIDDRKDWGWEYEKKLSEDIADAIILVAPKPEQPDQRLTVENAPVGTIAPAIMGGRWYRTELGWKWNGPNGSGGTFPRPGGDWNGELIAPKPEPTK